MRNLRILAVIFITLLLSACTPLLTAFLNANNQQQSPESRRKAKEVLKIEIWAQTEREKIEQKKQEQVRANNREAEAGINFIIGVHGSISPRERENVEAARVFNNAEAEEDAKEALKLVEQERKRKLAELEQQTQAQASEREAMRERERQAALQSNPQQNVTDQIITPDVTNSAVNATNQAIVPVVILPIEIAVC